MLFDDEVPRAISVDLINGTSDDDLADLLYHYTRVVLTERGCCSLTGPRDRDVLQELPRGLRVVWTTSALDGEVQNGGFYQWFTNSSGQCADLTVEDLRLIGADRQLKVVEEALALDRRLGSKYPDYAKRWERPEPQRNPEMEATFWSDVKSNFKAEYDRLYDAWYELEEDDSLWPKFLTWVRQQPESCVHSR